MISEGKVVLKCAKVQLMKEQGVMSNLVTLASVDSAHDVFAFEEYAEESAFTVGRDYEVTIKAVSNA